MPQLPEDQTRSFLEGMAENPGPQLYEMDVDDARGFLREVSKMFEIPPCKVGPVEDHAITYDSGDYNIRIYNPPGNDKDITPAIIMYHGGGFMLGDINTHDTIARYLCLHTGSKVINVDYRLAPEFTFPAGLEDCYHALIWVNENAEKLGIDPGKISLIGDSAGGNLCAGVARLSLLRGGPRISAMVMLYPSCDTRLETDYPSRDLYGNGDYFLGLKDIEWIMENYITDDDPANNPLLSPIQNTDFQGWPPTLVITAGMDILRDEGRAYYDLLRQHSVEARYLTYDGTIHGFVSFAGALDVGRKCLADIAQYFSDTH